MPCVPPNFNRRAFGLTELVVIVVVALIGVLICVIVIPHARRRARLAGSIQNLHQLGRGAHSYATDNDNRIFSFSWAPDAARDCSGYTFPTSTNYNDAAADQAVCILRTRGNRPDITVIRQWIPYIFFNHLVLVDYLNDTLPSPVLVSPGDAPRLAWFRAGVIASKDPNDQGAAYRNLIARPASSGDSDKRWPYSSSYQMPPAFFSPDAMTVTPSESIPTIAQSPMGHRWYDTGNARTVLGNRRMNEVAFPSDKVMMFESAQNFFGRPRWFAAPGARVPVLFSDGSVAVRASSDANAGFAPNSPLAPTPTLITYSPETTWEPPTVSGSASEVYNGIYLWTRSGLRGRDFNGPEIPWLP